MSTGLTGSVCVCVCVCACPVCEIFITIVLLCTHTHTSCSAEDTGGMDQEESTTASVESDEEMDDAVAKIQQLKVFQCGLYYVYTMLVTLCAYAQQG